MVSGKVFHGAGDALQILLVNVVDDCSSLIVICCVPRRHVVYSN